MTLQELTLIQKGLEFAEAMCVTLGYPKPAPITASLRIINREIDLKTMDPRKPRDERYGDVD